MRIILLIVVLGCLINGFVFLKIYTSNPKYLIDYRLNKNPDAVHYVLLGTNFIQKGVYSRQDRPPYKPDILRTPVYPVLAGIILTYAKQIWALYFVQILCTILSAIFIYLITYNITSNVILSILPSVLFLVDPLTISLNFQAMSESVFLLIFLGSIYCFLRAFRMENNLNKNRIYIIVASTLLSLSILTRPAALYFPLVLLPFMIVKFRCNIKKMLINLALTYGILFLLICPWYIRNYKTYGLLKISNAASINLLHFAAAGVYQLKYKISRNEAESMIIKKYNVPSLSEMNNFWLSKMPVNIMDELATKAGLKIILDNPVLFLRATLIGITKAFISHNAADFAYIFNSHYVRPGLRSIIKKQPQVAVKRLLENEYLIIAILVYQILVNVLTILLFLISGVYIVFYKRELPSMILLSCILYFLATVAIVGIDAYSRHRYPIVPFVLITISVWMNYVYRRCKLHKTCKA